MAISIIAGITFNLLFGIAIILFLDDEDYSFYEWVMRAPEPANTIAVIAIPMAWPIVAAALYRKNFKGLARR